MQRNGKIIWALFSIGIMLMALSIIPAVFAQSPAKWIKTFGSPADDGVYAAAISNDGYALAGSTNSSGQGQTDAWLVITDPDGSVKFNRTYGGLFSDIAYSIATTNDGGYVLAGSTTSYGAGKADVWLVKVDSLGNMQWNKTYGGPLADQCRSLIVTKDGGYALLCHTASYGAGNTDVWLIKVDSLGNMDWNQTYGGIGAESVSTIIGTSEGGYVLSCSSTSFGAGSADFWLIKVDSFGKMEWNRTYGGSGTEYANSVVATHDGGYAVAGSVRPLNDNNTSVWLVKVDALGNMQWNQIFGGPLADYCSSIVTSNKGDLVLACISQPPTRTSNYGDGDFWLANVDSLGNLLGNQTYGISAHHAHAFLLITASGDYILGGSTRDAMGNRDFWLAKIGETESGLEWVIYLLIIALFALVFVVLLTYWRKARAKPNLH